MRRQSVWAVDAGKVFPSDLPAAAGAIGPVTCQLHAIAESINVGARKAAAVGCMAQLSISADAPRYGAAALRCLDRTWELDEHETWVAEIRWRCEEEAALRDRFWSEDGSLSPAAYALQMKARRGGGLSTRISVRGRARDNSEPRW